MSFLDEYIKSGEGSLPINLPPGAIAPQSLETYSADENSILQVVNGVPTWTLIGDSSVEDATDAASVILRLNELLVIMRTKGFLGS